MIRFIPRTPNASEFLTLRAETDWGVPDASQMTDILAHSPWGIVAYDGDQIIGMTRCVGDGILILYLQDVIIAKSHRRQGIGRQLITNLIQHLEAICSQDCTIGLFAAIGQSGFYESLGFQSRNTKFYGPGMHGTYSDLLKRSLAMSVSST